MFQSRIDIILLALIVLLSSSAISRAETNSSDANATSSPSASGNGNGDLFESNASKASKYKKIMELMKAKANDDSTSTSTVEVEDNMATTTIIEPHISIGDEHLAIDALGAGSNLNQTQSEINDNYEIDPRIDENASSNNKSDASPGGSDDALHQMNENVSAVESNLNTSSSTEAPLSTNTNINGNTEETTSSDRGMYPLLDRQTLIMVSAFIIGLLLIMILVAIAFFCCRNSKEKHDEYDGLKDSTGARLIRSSKLSQPMTQKRNIYKPGKTKNTLNFLTGEDVNLNEYPNAKEHATTISETQDNLSKNLENEYSEKEPLMPQKTDEKTENPNATRPAYETNECAHSSTSTICEKPSESTTPKSPSIRNSTYSPNAQTSSEQNANFDARVSNSPAPLPPLQPNLAQNIINKRYSYIKNLSINNLNNNASEKKEANDEAIDTAPKYSKQSEVERSIARNRAKSIQDTQEQNKELKRLSTISQQSKHSFQQLPDFDNVERLVEGIQFDEDAFSIKGSTISLNKPNSISNIYAKELEKTDKRSDHRTSTYSVKSFESEKSCY